MCIFYSLPGEGLGHCARVLSILDYLEAEVHIFTWGEAYDFLKKENYPYLHKITSLPFGRNKKGKISTVKSIVNFLKFIKNYQESFDYCISQYHIHKPDLFIADFEGVLPRAAKHLNQYYLSIDNQHKFSRCDLSDLPFKLRMHAYGMGFYTEKLMPNPELAIVSTFYHSATKKYGNTILTNCFLRKKFEEITPSTGNYILVYYKQSMGEQILDLLKDQNNVKVYNFPYKKYHFQYCELSNENFIRDLAGCKALIASAGNQLLGEAIYYNKPMFLIPEPNQPEQSINVFYIKKMGYGDYTNDPIQEQIDNFLNNLTYKNEKHINGVHEVVDIINKYLYEAKRTG